MAWAGIGGLYPAADNIEHIGTDGYPDINDIYNVANGLPVQSPELVIDNLAYQAEVDWLTTSPYTTNPLPLAASGSLDAAATEINSPPTAFAIQGISMSVYSQNAYEDANYPALLRGEADDGANYVVISSFAEINLSTGAVSDYMPTPTGGGSPYDATASFSSIGPAIAAAEAQGLNVMLKPQIGAYDSWQPTGFGNITDPNLVLSKPAAFFSGYKAYILQWAELAQEYHVPIFSIGNEEVGLTKPQYTPYWDDIIAAVRQVYSGALTYSALLPLQVSDTASNEVAQIGFWNKLDYAGFDVYPSLTTELNPSISDLNAAWQSTAVGGQTQNYEQYVTSLAQSVGKPVLFTETGVASYPGATDGFDYGNSYIGAPTTQSDPTVQANWYASFFDTWAADKPSWLAGIFFWDNDTDDSSGPYYTENYDIDGKPAEEVVSAWFGGQDYLSSGQASFVGSVANDRIDLFGNQFSTALQAAGGNPVTLAETFNTTIALAIDGTIMNGAAPTIHVYVNGIDEGAQALTTTVGSYVDAAGVSWSAPQTYSYTLNGLVSLSQLKIAIDSPYDVGGPENAQTYISSVTVNGVALTDATYYPLIGSTQSETINVNSGTYAGGYTLIDATPWNTQLATIARTGTAAQPIDVNGGGGMDMVDVLGTFADYRIADNAGTVTLTENAGLSQNAVLTDISYIVFQDGTVFDIATDTLETVPVSIILDVQAALTAHANDSSATGILIADSVADVEANFANLQPMLSAIATINFTDTPAPTLTLASTVYATYAAIIDKISSPFDLAITFASGTDSVPAPINAAANGSGGQDTITGDGHVDTVIFPLPFGDYTAATNASGGITISGTNLPTIDTSGIGYFQFSDQVVAATDDDNVPIIALYQAALDRLPDPGGLQYWETIYVGNPASITTTIAGGFIGSAEFQAKYGTLDTDDFVTQLYENVLNRAPDPGGFAYWTNELASGTLTDAQVVVGFADSAENLANYDGTDFLFTQTGTDIFIGGDAAKTLFAPTAGNNTITGGTGIGKLIFTGDLSDYTVTQNGDGSISVTGATVTDHIGNVGYLQFSDQTVVATDSNDVPIAALYQAALGRGPDPGGLYYWENIYVNDVPASVHAGGYTASLAQYVPTGAATSIAGGFIGSAEFQAKYGSLDTDDFVTQLYENVLHRAPDPGGFAYWTGELTSGAMTKAMVLVGIADSAENLATYAGHSILIA